MANIIKKANTAKKRNFKKNVDKRFFLIKIVSLKYLIIPLKNKIDGGSKKAPPKDEAILKMIYLISGA